MKTSKNSLDAKLMTDILILMMFIAAAILFMQYSQEIENEIRTTVLNSVNDINGSIAETRTGR
ncbi:hypothetical protein [Maribacter cobaltidurans]|uniref:Uncharacterized protein n=1 Tax=Maribacter cobaltidurans TaxID=1178778 RepID=A0A223V8Q2_9FLAO|nr:hypothetical protein [Maribacter cobaltidurans]ASV31682.1 hypothetical protein CJ263_16485 [Maribacter cobaltidurans]